MSYHVHLQLNSTAWKGKSIPSVSACRRSHVHGRDEEPAADRRTRPGHPAAAAHTGCFQRDGKFYPDPRRGTGALKPGDMMIGDQLGVISDVICGLPGPAHADQSQYTQCSVFFVRATRKSTGRNMWRIISKDIRDYVLIFAPQAQVKIIEVFGTN